MPTLDTPPLISLRQVHKRFASSVQALAGVALGMHAGEFVALLGPPAWDPAFNAADFPLMLDLRDLPAAYRRRFLNPV